MSFDIASASKELLELEAERKRLQEALKKIKAREDQLKKNIGTYLERHNQQGVMIHNMTILNTDKVVRKPLKKQEKDDNLRSVLGDTATPELIERIRNASKGTATVKRTITIDKQK